MAQKTDQAMEAIKSQINDHLRKHAVDFKVEMPDVNREAKEITGKPRGEMTFQELNDFMLKIHQFFPINNADMDKVVDVNSPMPVHLGKGIL
jgi:hypothetical protein